MIENDKKPEKIESSYEKSVENVQNPALVGLTNIKKKTKHNYTSELELKSLLIRIKNHRVDIGTLDNNIKINKYIKWHTAINAKKYDFPSKRNITKAKLKAKIVELSEITRVNPSSYERFGAIILLMVKNILKKPQFSGYTYKDDFYSDAVYKILKYLHNFDHTLISDRTNQPVNAFAYISQIIHNSILFIINSKKKDRENLRKQVQMEHLTHNMQLKITEQINNNLYDDEAFYAAQEAVIHTVHLEKVNGSLVEEIKNMEEDINKATRVNIFYPKEYSISLEEYSDLRSLLKGKISIMRERDKEKEEE